MELGEAETWEPNPDIHELFSYYDSLYFDAALGPCLLSWSSSRMTSCAGVCRYQKDGGCEIRLSEPLLKFRSTADLKNTLLHEMIHAFLWIKTRNRDHSDHGLCFQSMMNAINSSSVTDYQRPKCGYKITIYHDFHEEVNSYRVHHWLCDLCGDLIKRAMNREPSASDCPQHVRHDGFCSDSSCKWHRHRMLCSGIYKKISEPLGFKDKRRGLKGLPKKEEANKPDIKRLKTIKNYFPTATDEDTKKSIKFEDSEVAKLKTFTPEIPKRSRTSTSRKCKYSCLTKKCKEIVVFSAWLGFYEYAETDEELPPLINKRTERRKKLRLIKEMRGQAPEDESLQDYAADGNNFDR